MKTLLEKLLAALPAMELDTDACEAVAASTRALLGDDALMVMAKDYYDRMFAPGAAYRKDIMQWSEPQADAVLGENMLFTVLLFARAAALVEEGKYTYGDNRPVDFFFTLRRVFRGNCRRWDSYGMVSTSRQGLYRFLIPVQIHLGRLVFEMNSFGFGYEVWRSRRTGETLPLMKAGLIFDDTDRPHTVGDFTTTRTEADGKLTGYTYTEKGLLDRNPVTLDLDEWEPFIVEGDPVVWLHIPGNDKFTPDVVDQALEYGKEFLARYFPEYNYKAFVCSSWLLGTDLAQFVRPESNILNFQKRFRIGLGFRNDFSLFDNVFDVPKHCPIEELVPTNRFQREILDMVKAGGTLYSGRGYILKD